MSEQIQEVSGIPVTYEHIQDLQIRYFEELYYTWEIAIRRYYLLKEGGSAQRFHELKQEEKVIVERALPFLKAVMKLRYAIKRAYTENEEIRRQCDERAEGDLVWWINNFVWGFDPRNNSLGLPSRIPFVVVPFQADILKRIDLWVSSKMNGLIEKCRAAGLTELCICYAVHKFRYMPGFKTLFSSNLEVQVDKRGDPDTLFERIRRIIYALPVKMRPTGFEKKGNANDNTLLLVNPDNGNTIVGRGGDNVGVGGRNSVAFVDEKAKVQHPVLVDDGVGANTDCQIDVSTPFGMNHFYQKRMAGNVDVYTVNWYLDPQKNIEWKTGKKPSRSAWYECHVLKYSAEWIAQNIDIDYQASIEGVFIPPEWVRATVNFEIPLNPKDPKIAGFDIGASKKQTSIYGMRQGPVLRKVKVLPYSSPLEAIWAAADEATADGVAELNYDRQTIGEDVEPALKKGGKKITFRLVGIYGQSQASERYLAEEGQWAYEKFSNKRTEIWWNLRERAKHTFEHVNDIAYYPTSQLMSIPNDPLLIAELSTPLIKYRNGKKAIEGKIEMKARNVASPNKADMCAYAYADYEGERYVLDEFDYTEMGENFKEFAVDFDNAGADNYVSIVYTPDMKVAAIAAFWWSTKLTPLLQVYAEYEWDNQNAKTIVADIKRDCSPLRRPVREWIGNEEMYKNAAKSRMVPWHEFAKEKVHIVINYEHDQQAAISLLNDMFKNKMAQVHTGCEGLMSQARNWVIKRGKPNQTQGKLQALLQMVGRLKRKRQIDEVKVNRTVPYNQNRNFMGGKVNDAQKSALMKFIQMAEGTKGKLG